MFLRTGWVVGNAGLGGAWLIIAVSFLITGCTGLSMSSFVTNIRVGSGGAFSMISQSLGLEVGGSIGIPLYLAQVLAVSMYVFGFREGWLWIFPQHEPLYIDLATFTVIFIITFVSAHLAVKVQYLILTIIIAAIGSVALAAITGPMQYDTTLWGDFPGDKSTGFGDVRSGIVMALAEWAAKRMRMMEGNRERVWKPHLLVPTDDARELLGINRLVYELAHPSGSVKLLGITKDKRLKKLRSSLKKAKETFQEEGVFCAASTLHSQNFANGLRQGMEALSGTIFQPNLLFLTLPAEKSLQNELEGVIEAARDLNLAVALFVQHPKAGLGRRRIINVWIGDQGPDWDIKMRFDNLDISLLLAYRLCQSWQGELNLIVAVEEKKHENKAKEFLSRLSEAARLPSNTKVLVADGDFGRFSSKAPHADINFFPLAERLDAKFMINMRDQTDSACLFSQDSGTESALA